MNHKKYAIAFILFTLMTCSLIIPRSADSLTCPRYDFKQKMQKSKNIIIGQVLDIKEVNYQTTYLIEVIQIVKTNGLVKKRDKTITINYERYMGIPFTVKKGQVILFFFHDDRIYWNCIAPILIQQ